MQSIFKNVALWLLVIGCVTVTTCATLVTFNQIQGPQQAGVVMTDASGKLSVSPVTTQAPKISVTTVTLGTPNSFPLPTGTSTCIVSQAIIQALNVDYVITAGAVVFNVAPGPGAVVQLACW